MKFIKFFTILIGVTGAKYTNHQSCYDILDNWWYNRVDRISRGHENIWDKVCEYFNGDRNACIHKGIARIDYFNNGDITADEMNKVPCVMLGAHSDHCVSNPCNHYNTGHCTIQETAGLCNWYTKKRPKSMEYNMGVNAIPVTLVVLELLNPKTVKHVNSRIVGMYLL